jgi:histidine triad (HIT) family protein
LEDGCIFCKIVRKELDATVVLEDDDVLAFEDINGRAPVHVLVIPKRHVANLEEISRLEPGVAHRLLEASSEAAAKLGATESGYAVRINNGPDANQEVFHLHLHVLGGRELGMP